MGYSQDLRERVISFAEKNGKAEAARTFKISRKTVYNWLARSEAGTPGPKGPRKVNMAALEQHVTDHNDMYLAERAAHFGMSINGIWMALKRLDLVKKNVAVHRKM